MSASIFTFQAIRTWDQYQHAMHMFTLLADEGIEPGSDLANRSHLLMRNITQYEHSPLYKAQQPIVVQVPDWDNMG